MLYKKYKNYKLVKYVYVLNRRIEPIDIVKPDVRKCATVEQYVRVSSRYCIVDSFWKTCAKAKHAF